MHIQPGYPQSLIALLPASLQMAFFSRHVNQGWFHFPIITKKAFFISLFIKSCKYIYNPWWLAINSNESATRNRHHAQQHAPTIPTFNLTFYYIYFKRLRTELSSRKEMRFQINGIRTILFRTPEIQKQYTSIIKYWKTLHRYWHNDETRRGRTALDRHRFSRNGLCEKYY